jgi:hypothetical protein
MQGMISPARRLITRMPVAAIDDVFYGTISRFATYIAAVKFIKEE